ncbi:TIR domain-containing protein [Silvibacterium dinghuense]|uniref:TIR domain-containing protein n=1 Tax=Silvibacterium dinghuense TaxID=1560006 RepID=A0A4V1NVV1_9BACT|nr:TIR domain-containing protein [Silvibacterium dinghuense]RXS97202.1 TIR domain-containing protein [Silvibacterium dinghuense]GGG97047.1 hypothetical protein GCM10011586_10370 [Silvibacterium dinghuense]
MKRVIFISYRRDDSEGEAGRLYDDLVRTYGDQSVFMDVAGIAPGVDFRQAIDDNVAGCGVCLVMLGPQWATITGSTGQRRLDDPNDFVRLEVSSALRRNIPVIPVLVHDARMPHPEQLPEEIRELAYRNSVEISHARWNSDVQLLVDALKPYVEATRLTETQPVHATVPVQLPPPVAPQGQTPVPPSKLPQILGISVTVFVLLGAGIVWMALHGGNHAPAPASGAPSQAVSAPKAAAGSPSASLAGTWHSNRAKNGGHGPVELRITGTDPAYQVEVLADCPQGECSWGTQPVIFVEGEGTARWLPRLALADVAGKRVARVTLRPAGALLNMEIQNSWTVDGQSKRNRADVDFSREP